MEIGAMIIDDPVVKKKVVSVVRDDVALRILDATRSRAMSVSELRSSLSLPLTSTYRRVNSLLDAGLLVSEHSIVTDTGARYHLYRSAVRSISLSYGDGELTVEVLPNQDVINKFMRFWRTLGGKPD